MRRAPAAPPVVNDRHFKNDRPPVSNLESPPIQVLSATPASAPNHRGALGWVVSSHPAGAPLLLWVCVACGQRICRAWLLCHSSDLRGELGRPRWIRRKTNGADAKCYVQLKGVNSSLVQKYWHAVTALVGSISASVFSAFTRRNQSAWQTPSPCSVDKSPLITGRPSLSMIVCVGTLSRHSPIP